MRAWLFCRVTNGWDADSRDHLALQKAELERFCAEQGLTVVGATMVTGSGKNELQELVHSGVVTKYHAGVAELADALDLGSSVFMTWGFKSLHPHHL